MSAAPQKAGPKKGKTGDPRATVLAIENFLKTSRQPVLMEPGDDPLPLTPDSFALHERNGIVTLECWNDTRNLVRRIRGILREERGRLDLTIERFGGRTGALTLVDLANPAHREMDRRGARLKYRERFRRSLCRQFPGWRLAELSTEADLHHSLSPSYPRALLRRGTTGLAAIGAAEDALSIEGALTFGLIWLDYLRRREVRLAKGLNLEGLAIFLPAGAENVTCHRIRYLDSRAARFLVFIHQGADWEAAVDPADYTNLQTRLDPCREPLAGGSVKIVEWIERLASVAGVDRRVLVDGSIALSVRGLEFARASGDAMVFGLDRKHPATTDSHIGEIVALARELERMRRAGAADPANPLYTRRLEAWLESQVRASIESLDAMLYPNPVYGQVPQFAAGERGVIDLLAADREGRLTVIEVKADEDIHLPLQALDYWMRVKWHLDRGEFTGRGYFPGVGLKTVPPRLLLVAPALGYHPSNETVLRYFSPEIEVERVGVGLEWRRELRVMFRIPKVPWPSLSSARSSTLSRI